MTDITGPITINAPGSYRLINNIAGSFAAEGPIDILADNVKLDLNGFTIGNTFGPMTQARGIVVTGNNVTIRNGNVEGFYFGIEQSAGNKGKFHDIIIPQTWYRGLQVWGTYADIKRVVVISCGGCELPGDYRIAIGIENNADIGITEDCQVLDVFGRDTPQGPAEGVAISHTNQVGSVRNCSMLAPTLRDNSWATWFSSGGRYFIDWSVMQNHEHGVPQPTGSLVGARNNLFVNVDIPIHALSSDLHGNRWIDLPESEPPPPPGEIQNRATQAGAIASSSAPSCPPSRAFDDDLNTDWETNGAGQAGAYIGNILDAPYSLTRATIRQNGGLYAVDAAYLDYSDNNGVTFAPLFPSPFNLADNTDHEFNFSGLPPHRTYAWRAAQATGGGVWSVYDAGFWG